MNVATERRGDKRQKPTRTCAGCARPDGPDAMVRLVLGPALASSADSADGSAARPATQVAVDMAGGAFGRGAHVHPDPACLAKACKGGLSRAFKTSVVADLGAIAQQIVDGCDRRALGLIMAARRASVLAVGADATCDALDDGARAVLVASDAGGVARKSQIVDAISAGRGVAWGNKAALGQLLGRDEVAVCAVRDAGIASELIHVMSVRSRCFACSRSEAR